MTSFTDQNRSIFITGLRNAHAVEAEALQLIDRQLDRLSNYPAMAERLRVHRTETETQRSRLEQLLAHHNDSPSTVKEAVMGLMGNMAAIAHSPADDEILKNTFANLAFENYEIAAYTSLITMADSLGQTNALGLLKQSLDEEKRMAQWIEDNVPETTRRFLELRAAGQKADR
jgi:ferritin-like metal-binding protein YciE